MSQKPIKISIDTITNDTVCNYNNIRKGDTLLMSISMYQNSASLNLTGQTVHVILKKSDGYSVEKILTGLTSNVIPILFDEQATICMGEVIGEVLVIDANGCSISNHFTYDVGETNADNIIIASRNELDTLTKIQILIDNYNANADNLATQNALALTNISTIEAKVEIANTSKTELDASKTNADASKAALEVVVQEANTFVTEHGDIIDLEARVTANEVNIATKESVFIGETLPEIADRKEKTIYIKITDIINSNTGNLTVSPTMGIKLV